MFGWVPPVPISPSGLEYRDVQSEPLVAFIAVTMVRPTDDIASIELDLADACVYTASTELPLTDEEIENALLRLPWALQDRRARRW